MIPELKGASPTEKQEVLETKFSHAREFITRRDLESARNDKETRKKVAKVIAEGKIKGAEMRELQTVLKHSRASEALERGGSDVAREVLRKADPTTDSKVLKSVEKLTAAIETLDQDDLEIFRAHDKARQALRALITAVSNVLDMTQRKDKRHA